MIDRITTAAAFTAYQSSVALGITLLPLAIVARRLGVTLPIHRLIQRLESTYESTR